MAPYKVECYARTPGLGKPKYRLTGPNIETMYATGSDCILKDFEQTANAAFEAGARSRQPEIESLKAEITARISD